MTRDRHRLALPILALVACGAAFAAAQGTSPSGGSRQIWDAGARNPDWRMESTLTLVNGCRNDHAFSVTKTKADFLDFLFTSPVRVPGKSTTTVRVRFHTNGMSPGDYTGAVTVTCVDCDETPACTQNRKEFAPHVTVVPRGALTADNPGSSPSTGCVRDCGDLFRAFNQAQALAKAQQQIWLEANRAVISINRDAKAIEKEIKQATEFALKNLVGKDATEFHKGLAKLHLDYQKAIDDFSAASKKADAERTKLDALTAQADAALKVWQACATANGLCQTDDVPKPCTQASPCTTGWTSCDPGQACDPPQLCTTDHPCTIGSAVKSLSPVTKTKTPCTTTKDDCEQLRRLADIREAEARAAEKTAADAAAEAVKQEAAATQTAGKDPRDVVAQQAIAQSARDNAVKLEQAAARVRATAAAARKAAADCLTRSGSTCTAGTSPSGRSSGAAGARNCESLRLAWQEAERQAVLAQVLADQAARNQQWSKSDADYLESQAAKDEEYAKGQTDRARQYRDLGGTARGLAMKDREIAARSAPGSKDQLAWTKAAADDEADAVKWNADADAAEQTELQYHMKAAAERAKAAQLRGSPSSAKSAADAAKAAAAAAKKAYDDCAARRD